MGVPSEMLGDGAKYTDKAARKVKQAQTELVKAMKSYQTVKTIMYDIKYEGMAPTGQLKERQAVAGRRLTRAKKKHNEAIQNWQKVLRRSTKMSGYY